MKSTIYSLFLLLLGCGTNHSNLKIAPKLFGGDASDIVQKVNTDNKKTKIDRRLHRYFEDDGIIFDSKYNGAKMSSVKRLAPFHYQMTTEMENSPINDSPWYGFKFWSANEQQKIKVELVYPSERGLHRYNPKLSANGIKWNQLSSEHYVISEDKKLLTMNLTAEPVPQFISAQENYSSDIIKNWAKKLSNANTFVHYKNIKKLKSGRTIPLLTIEGNPKKMVILLARQHPPEVTGSIALEAFVNEIASDSKEAREYRGNVTTLVLPILNPDGVDSGFWRHNYGGIDLNRDWGFFNQPELKSVHDELLKHSDKVVFMIDFHSTHKDYFYLIDAKLHQGQQDTALKWIEHYVSEHKEIDFEVRRISEKVYYSTSVYWFHTNFKCPSISYELGDNTNREIMPDLARAMTKSFNKIFN